MRKSVALLLLALLGTAMVLPAFADLEADAIEEEDDEYEDPGLDIEDRAILIAHKFIVEDKIVQGRNVTVVVSISNIGQSAATAVTIKDALPGLGNFQLIEGALEANLGTIDVGSQAEIRYTAIAREGNKGNLAESATITYQPLADDAKTTTLLSTSPYMFVLTRGQSIQMQLVKAGKYVSLGMLKSPGDWISSGVVIGLVLLVIGVYTGCTSVSQQRADHRRKQFSKELGIGSE